MYKSNHLKNNPFETANSSQFFLLLFFFFFSLSLPELTDWWSGGCFFRTETPQLNQPAKTGKMPLWLLQESRQPLGSDP